MNIVSTSFGEGAQREFHITAPSLEPLGVLRLDQMVRAPAIDYERCGLDLPFLRKSYVNAKVISIHAEWEPLSGYIFQIQPSVLLTTALHHAYPESV
jgi:hypothetical protein